MTERKLVILCSSSIASPYLSHHQVIGVLAGLINGDAVAGLEKRKSRFTPLRLTSCRGRVVKTTMIMAIQFVPLKCARAICKMFASLSVARRVGTHCTRDFFPWVHLSLPSASPNEGAVSPPPSTSPSSSNSD
jgi:hypothetical protein